MSKLYKLAEIIGDKFYGKIKMLADNIMKAIFDKKKYRDFSTITQNEKNMIDNAVIFEKYILGYENDASFRYTLFPPFFLEKNGHINIFVGSLDKQNKFKLFNCFIISVYDPETRKFAFAQEKFIDGIKNNWVNFNVFSHNSYKNVDPKSALRMSMMFRMAWYDANIEYYDKISKEKIINESFVIFEIQKPNKSYVKMYALIDFGLKRKKSTLKNMSMLFRVSSTLNIPFKGGNKISCDVIKQCHSDNKKVNINKIYNLSNFVHN